MDPEYLYLEPVKGFNTTQAAPSPNLPSQPMHLAAGCAGETGTMPGPPGVACHQARLCCHKPPRIARKRERCPVPSRPVNAAAVGH